MLPKFNSPSASINKHQSYVIKLVHVILYKPAGSNRDVYTGYRYIGMGLVHAYSTTIIIRMQNPPI